ncbi:MAG TPA: sigma-54 dependent transcriptional regulator [Candidatus Binataceae bacterium]|nr:sigma-54 dependent transcriptional regulator [Candidatus Binataceae bacterium]
MSERILIVDDDELMARYVERILASAGFECEVCLDAEKALNACETRRIDLVISDVVMPSMNGTELMRRIRERMPMLPVILLTSYGSIEAAVEAMRAGAFGYLTKPAKDDELLMLVRRALEMTRLERENRLLRQELNERYGPDAFVAVSDHSRTLLESVRRIAPSRATVLIQGESGTGKELVARLIHFWSNRVGQPFVAVNCKAFGEGVLDSELFGHEKGAFTGAIMARPGCFERASGGTLFLDEIGDIGADFQAKLLRVLQEGEILRVGGAAPRKIDVRVVCATNRNLREEVGAGRFREDLYFRLNVIPVTLAPLRERRDDIVPLARHFLSSGATLVGRNLRLSAEAERALHDHAWPGNVRELENVIERIIVMAHGDEIGPQDLVLDTAVIVPRANGAAAAVEPLATPLEAAPIAQDGSSDEDEYATLDETLDLAIANRLREAIERARGNRSEAAKMLGLNRTKFYRLLRRIEQSPQRR